MRCIIISIARGYSTIIRESRDFSCVILDRDGRLIVAAPMFSRAGYRHLVGRILDVYGTGQCDREGERIRLQPPLRGRLRTSPTCVRGAGLADAVIVAFSVVAPQGRTSRAVPGSTSCRCDGDVSRRTSASAGEDLGSRKARADIERIILTNSRQPALVRGDLHARSRSRKMGATRVKELCGPSAPRRDRWHLRDPQGRRASSGRDREAPEGIIGEGFLDSDGVVVDKPIKLAVTVAVKDASAHFDFSNSDPQAKDASTAALDGGSLRLLCADRQPRPDLHFNDGLRDVVRLTFAPRTITNADPLRGVDYQMVNPALVT